MRCAPRNGVAERLKAMEELVGNLRNRIEYYEKQEETRAESPGPDADYAGRDAALRVPAREAGRTDTGFGGARRRY